MTYKTPFFFEDKPIFGLDIGHGSLRVLEINRHPTTPKIVGYGTAAFDPSAMQNGVITKPEVVAEAALELFKKHLIGDITTNRVAMSVPVARAYTRVMEVPELADKDLMEAVRTEAEQYIPASLDDLYIDYSRVAAIGGKEELLIVAIPKEVVASHMNLARLLGLEVVLLETSISACAQLFAFDRNSDIPSLLIDFGSDSADITAFDNGIAVSGTVACGGNQITKLIEDALHVSAQEADIIKSKYGLSYSKKQKQIEAALTPLLGVLLKEIRRTIRYYEDRASGKQTVGQILVMGGGANMVGLSDYLTSSLRLPVRSFDPTTHINFGKLQPFSIDQRMSYVTVAGLAMVNPVEIFA